VLYDSDIGCFHVISTVDASINQKFMDLLFPLLICECKVLHIENLAVCPTFSSFIQVASLNARFMDHFNIQIVWESIVHFNKIVRYCSVVSSAKLWLNNDMFARKRWCQKNSIMARFSFSSNLSFMSRNTHPPDHPDTQNLGSWIPQNIYKIYQSEEHLRCFPVLITINAP
jgi:hypothetical protein